MELVAGNTYETLDKMNRVTVPKDPKHITLTHNNNQYHLIELETGWYISNGPYAGRLYGAENFPNCPLHLDVSVYTNFILED